MDQHAEKSGLNWPLKLAHVYPEKGNLFNAHKVLRGVALSLRLSLLLRDQQTVEVGKILTKR